MDKLSVDPLAIAALVGFGSLVLIGVGLYLAVGPIRVDLAWPLQKDEWVEDDVRVQFNMGYQFR